MSRLTQNPQGAPFALFKNDTDTSDQTYVGQKFVSADGREFTLVFNGASATAAGKLYQAPATIANHQNLATATAVASTVSVPNFTVTVTLGATAVTANQYARGYVVINAGTGAGQTFEIASHPAANASAALTLTLADPIVSALNVSDTKSCLIAHQDNGVIISPTTATGRTAGVSLYAFAAGTFGYLQTKGPVACLCDSVGAAVGTAISPSAATPGAITQTPYATNLVTGAVIGSALQAGVSAEYRTVFIDC